MTAGQKKALIWVSFSVVSAFLAYVGYSIYKQVMLLEEMDVNFAGISILPPQGEDAGLSIKLSLTNKSKLTINVNQINCDVYLNDKYVSKVLQNTNQNVAPLSTSQVQFDVYFNVSDVISNAVDLSSLNLNSIILKVVGYASCSVDGINIKNYPVNYTSSIGDLVGNS
jgi:LEA14-like dessication related protein